MAFRKTARFLSEAIRHPLQTGAIGPSSDRLTQEITDGVDWGNVSTVVEYGPGTGILTGQILKRMRPGTKFFAIEVNPEFVTILEQRYPEVTVYQESVANVKMLVERQKIDKIDAVISGLPWANFSEEAQEEYLEAMLEVMRPGAQFATFAYLLGLLLPRAHRFKSKLVDRFSEVGRSRVVWSNLPPALVYRCRK